MPQILDGKALAERLRRELAVEVQEVTKARGRPPGLGVVLVGDDPASAIYVRHKEKAATEIGMLSKVVRLPASASEAEVLAAVDGINEDRTIDAFLVQLPLPNGIDARTVTARVRPEKDADGLHPVNLGRLFAGLPGPRPCTPVGCMRLIDEAKINLVGVRAVVIGRSELVGKPVAHLLLERHATVTLCHSRTKDLAAEVGRAQVIVAAVGKPGLVRGEWIAPGAVVIDVGTTKVDGKLRGDVEFDTAKERAGAITPVPGGVGPMTIAMLLTNAVAAARA